MHEKRNRHNRFEFTVVGTEQHKEREEEDVMRLDNFWVDVVNAVAEYDRTVTSEMYLRVPNKEEDRKYVFDTVLDEFHLKFGKDCRKPESVEGMYAIERFLSSLEDGALDVLLHDYTRVPPTLLKILKFEFVRRLNELTEEDVE